MMSYVYDGHITYSSYMCYIAINIKIYDYYYK